MQRSDEAELRGLMIAGLAGDRTAYRALLAGCAPRLRGFFRKRLPAQSAEVEDLVQETLMSVHAKRASYVPALPFTPWLFAIARHRLVDLYRREGRRAPMAVLDLVDCVADPDFEETPARIDIDNLLGRLPPKQEEALRLTRLEGLSGIEAAARTTQTAGSIKVNAHRGLHKLMELVRSEPRGEG